MKAYGYQKDSVILEDLCDVTLVCSLKEIDN